jgi:outer membrane immunogenic protein
MSKVILAAIAALGLGFARVASAADLSVKAPPPAPVVVPSWTGVYLGINGGGAWGTTDHTDQFAVTTGNFNTSGGLVGGTYGFNWQSGKFVIGYEGDFDWANINGTLTTAGPPFGLCSVSGGTTCFTNLKNFSTARGRVGFDLNGWLLFGTAGYGWGQVNAGQNPCALTVFGGFSCNQTWRSGWVAGGGVEKMFAPHWSVKVEYLHYDFGNDINYQPATIAGGNRVSVLERGDMVRVGVNYNFGWPSQGPVVAKY